jgi:hypothetical protein
MVFLDAKGTGTKEKGLLDAVPSCGGILALEGSKSQYP